MPEVNRQANGYGPNGVNHSMPNDASVFRAKNTQSANSVVTFRWANDAVELGMADRYREAKKNKIAQTDDEAVTLNCMQDLMMC